MEQEQEQAGTTMAALTSSLFVGAFSSAQRPAARTSSSRVSRQTVVTPRSLEGLRIARLSPFWVIYGVTVTIRTIGITASGVAGCGCGLGCTPPASPCRCRCCHHALVRLLCTGLLAAHAVQKILRFKAC